MGFFGRLSGFVRAPSISGYFSGRTKGGTPQNKAFAINFGEPESVIDNDMTSYLGTHMDHREFYEPPINKQGLANTRFANGFHGRMPYFRRDRLLNLFEPSALLTRQQLGLCIEDLLVTADTYLHIEYNAFGSPIRLTYLPSIYMRLRPVGAKGGYRYCYVQNNGEVRLNFYEHEIIHIKQDDLRQSLYGVPEYYGAIQSVLLNEAATLFRRRYFINGAHLGSLFLSTSAMLKPRDEQLIKEKISKSKGLGNFRSMFLHMPGHQKASDIFNVVPVGDVATRDEFEKIKNLTDHDISAAWGTREEVVGIMPKVVGGTGDIDKLHQWDYEVKTLPLINLFLDNINQRLTKATKISFAEPTFIVQQS